MGWPHQPQAMAWPGSRAVYFGFVTGFAPSVSHRQIRFVFTDTETHGNSLRALGVSSLASRWW